VPRIGFSRIFLLGILIFKGLTVRRFYKSFGVKGLIIIPLILYKHKSKESLHDITAYGEVKV
jgi:hypothetical protein